MPNEMRERWFADARRLWALVVEAAPELGGVMAPLVTAEHYVVTGMYRGDVLHVPLKPHRETGFAIERVVLTPGKGPRSGTFTPVDASTVKELATVFLVALEGLALDKRTYLGLRLDDFAGVVTVAWSAARMAPVGDLEVDVPPSLAKLDLVIPVRLVESHVVEGAGVEDQIALVYEVELESLSLDDAPARRFKLELRIPEPMFAETETLQCLVVDRAKSDLAEALGHLFAYDARSRSAPERPPPPVIPLPSPVPPLEEHWARAAVERTGSWVAQVHKSRRMGLVVAGAFLALVVAIVVLWAVYG